MGYDCYPVGAKESPFKNHAILTVIFRQTIFYSPPIKTFAVPL
jgi:hypothetical protein